MIRLTWIIGNDEGAIWIPDNVIVTEVKGATHVSVPAIEGHWEVKESPEEVARKVMEYRLSMEQYKHSYSVASQHHHDAQTLFEEAQRELIQLAGLEEKGEVKE
nr:hypothetical protein [Aneurinibacillus sp. XH2]